MKKTEKVMGRSLFSVPAGTEVIIKEKKVRINSVKVDVKRKFEGTSKVSVVAYAAEKLLSEGVRIYDTPEFKKVVIDDFEFKILKEKHTVIVPYESLSPEKLGLCVGFYTVSVMKGDELADLIGEEDVSEYVAYLCDYAYYNIVKPGELSITYADEADYDEAKDEASSSLFVDEEVEEIEAPKIEPKKTGPAVTISRDDYVSMSPESYAAIKTGQYILDIEWNEKVKKYIPDLSYLDNFVPTKLFFELFNKIRRAKSMGELRKINGSLVGHPGGGKTSMCMALAAAFGMPFFTLTMHPFVEDDTFQGKTVFRDGELTMIETEFLLAFLYGGFLLIDEVNHCPPAIMSMMNDAVVAPYIIEKFGVERAYRSENSIIFCAHNPETASCREIDEAFDRRLAFTRRVETPTDEAFIEWLMLSVNNKPLCKWAYDRYKSVKSFLARADEEGETCARAIAIDQIIAVMNDVLDGRDSIDALDNFWAKVWGRYPKLGEELEKTCAAQPPYKG